MPETLLRTKLFVPPIRATLVPRPHLIERLNQGLQFGHRLTLISAPAGCGLDRGLCENGLGSFSVATFEDVGRSETPM
jgi:hypothetical protein